MFGGAGFIMGVSTYQDTCMKNIMALENSPLADDLRARVSNVLLVFLPLAWRTIVY